MFTLLSFNDGLRDGIIWEFFISFGDLEEPPPHVGKSSHIIPYKTVQTSPRVINQLGTFQRVYQLQQDWLGLEATQASREAPL